MSGGGFIDDVVDVVADPIKDFGSDVVKAGEAFIEDPLEFTGNLIEYAGDNPLETAAMVAAAIYAPDMFASWAAEAGAATAAEAAAVAEAAAIAEGATAAEAAIAAQTAYDASIASAAAAAAEAANASAIQAAQASYSPWGISAATPATEFGTFNPSTVSSIGIQAPEASTLGSLGGTAAMEAGTAGLTAEQLAQASANAQVGSNAASGLGYLGGAEALPSGTAGITGVSAPLNITPRDAQQALKLGQLLFGQQQQIPQYGFNQRQVKPAGMVDYSPTLTLLEQRVRTPNVYSLLG